MKLNQIETIRYENHEKWLQKNQERFQQFLTDFKQVHTSVIEYQHTFFEQLQKIEHSETLQSNLKELKTKAIALNIDQDITQSIDRCLSHVKNIVDNISMPSSSLYQNHVLRISALFEIMLLDLSQSKRLPFDDLPNDISRQIFKLFDMKTLARATNVSKKWYQQGNEEYYWKHKLQGFPNLDQNNNNRSAKDIYKNLYALAQQLKSMPNGQFADKAKDQINIFDMCSHFEKLATKLTPNDIFYLINTHSNQHPKSVHIFLNSTIIRAKLKQFIQEDPEKAGAEIAGIISNFMPSNQDQAEIAISLYLLNPQELLCSLLLFTNIKVLYTKLLDSPEVLHLFNRDDLAALIYLTNDLEKDLAKKLLLTMGSDFRILKALDNSYVYLTKIKEYPDIAFTVLKKSGFLSAVKRGVISHPDMFIFAKSDLKYCLALLESPILTEQFDASRLSSRLGTQLEQLTNSEFEITLVKILESNCIDRLDLFVLLTNACKDESRIKQVLDDPRVLNRLSHDQIDSFISNFGIQSFAARSTHIQARRLVDDSEQVDPDNNNALARIR